MTSKMSYVFNFCLIFLIVILLAVNHLPLVSLKDAETLFLGDTRSSLLNFTQQTVKYGYASEEHTVVTEDGYILTVFRIVVGRRCHGTCIGPPVILMHGLQLSSDCWIDAGPDAGLGYLIADACHDIWLGNTRGNYHSRRHITLDPDKEIEYWEFTVEEIGYYDLPAFIDYVLKYTGSEKVNYIGYSQGAGTYFAMCSERPEYCDKARILIALAPATRHFYTKSPVFRFSTETAMEFEDDLKKYGVYEMFRKDTFLQEYVGTFCQFTEKIEHCDTLKNLFDSVNSPNIGSASNKTLRTMFHHFPAGTSVHNMARYGQAVRSRKFEKFDYGKAKNMELYGRLNPPEFNLSAVSVPVVVMYGQNDGIVDIRDVRWLLRKLPHVLEAVLVKDPLWNHLDMAYSQYISKAIFPKINEYLCKYSHSYICN